MSNTTTTARIYVVCLASYNAGKLHGRWIDANQDADSIRDEVAAMLRDSDEPNAEEWAIHDYEGFDGVKIGEHDSFETVAALAEAVEEHGEAFAAWWSNQSRDSVDVDAFQDEYRGRFDSEADFAEEECKELYAEELKGLPDLIRFNINWAGLAHDLRCGGDVWFHRGSDGVHVFGNS